MHDFARCLRVRVCPCRPRFCPGFPTCQAEAGTGAGDDPEYPLSSVLRKNEGTLSVVAEYRQILKSGGCRYSVIIPGEIEQTVPMFIGPLLRTSSTTLFEMNEFHNVCIHPVVNYKSLLNYVHNMLIIRWYVLLLISSTTNHQ